jgi:hypothetical protein
VLSGGSRILFDPLGSACTYKLTVVDGKPAYVPADGGA